MTESENKLEIGTETDRQHTVETKLEKTKQGWLGWIFGSPAHAPTSICGLAVLLLILIGAVVSFRNSPIDPLEYWKSIVVPLTTAVFGHLFTKKQ